MKMKNPIFLALDVSDVNQALRLAQETVPYVGGFKIGPRLILKGGPPFVSAIAQLAPVFVDQKYFDIPNTMVESVRASFDAGASFVTIHAQAGKEALQKLAQLEGELQKIRPFKLLAVTVLTSFSENTLPVNWQSKPIAEHVLLLAEACHSAGITGIVCSAIEAEMMRKKYPKIFILTPGIRLDSGQSNDQARVLGPKEALNLGASALVVGRPIIESKDPIAAAKEFSLALG